MLLPLPLPRRPCRVVRLVAEADVEGDEMNER